MGVSEKNFELTQIKFYTILTTMVELIFIESTSTWTYVHTGNLHILHIFILLFSHQW